MSDPRRTPDDTHTREREVIVTNGGGDRGPMGLIIGLLVVVALVIIGVLLWNTLIGGTGDETEIEGPNVEVPTELDVDVDQNGGGGDGADTNG